MRDCAQMALCVLVLFALVTAGHWDFTVNATAAGPNVSIGVAAVRGSSVVGAPAVEEEVSVAGAMLCPLDGVRTSRPPCQLHLASPTSRSSTASPTAITTTRSTLQHRTVERWSHSKTTRCARCVLPDFVVNLLLVVPGFHFASSGQPTAKNDAEGKRVAEG